MMLLKAPPGWLEAADGPLLTYLAQGAPRAAAGGADASADARRVRGAEAPAGARQAPRPPALGPRPPVLDPLGAAGDRQDHAGADPRRGAQGAAGHDVGRPGRAPPASRGHRRG